MVSVRKIFALQSLMLFGGVVFAWSTVAGDYVNFTKGLAANPLTTPCFYGAVGFLVFYFYSLFIFFSTGKIQLKHQKILILLLTGGTLFGWGNFALELCRFYIFKNPVSCSGASSVSPFLTPCFFGSVIYLASLLTSFIVFKKLRKRHANI